MSVSSGHAQDARSEVSVQAPFNITRHSDSLNPANDATKSGGFQFGFRQHLGRLFAVEADYGYTRNTQKDTDQVFGETDIQTSIHQLTGAAVITAPAGRKVRPYALAGVAGLFFRPTNTVSNVALGAQNETKAAFVYGGGLDFDLTKHMAFRGEYRGLVYKIPDFQITGLAANAFTHTAQPSIGLVWRF